MVILEALAGVFIGGIGSWIGRWLGIYEKGKDYQHELLLLEKQLKIENIETEKEEALAEHAAYAQIRKSSYEHDTNIGETSILVNNALRFFRPLLTVMLVMLVWRIWHSLDDNDHYMRQQITDGVLFMASAALGWWFGDRAPRKDKLPWQ